MPGATVIALNLGTNQVRETAADQAGYFRFPLLQVGDYQLLVSASGFADYQRTGIRLNVGTRVRVDVELALGGTTETVTVTAAASMVLAGQGASGEVLGEEAVRALPITSRNVYNFHLVGPGVKGLPSTGFGTTQFLVGGHNRMTWSMDGIDNSQRRTNRQIRLVISTPENVEEMQVLTGAYSAEFGRAAGGVINVVSRSGTNTLRGGTLALVRPTAWAARPPLASVKPQQEWWMIQGNAGGPLVKDRLFFFANYEYNPLKLPQPVTINPAAAAAIGIPAADLGNSPFGGTFHTPSVKVNFRANDAQRVRALPQPLHQRSARRRRRPDHAQSERHLQGPDVRHRRPAGDDVRRRPAQRAAVRLQPAPRSAPYGRRRPTARTSTSPASPTSASTAGRIGRRRGQPAGDRQRHLDGRPPRHKAGFDVQTTGYDVTSAQARVFSFTGLPAPADAGP